MRKRLLTLVALLLVAGPALAQAPELAKEVRVYVKVEAPVVALAHVRVIDGTGAPPQEDQTVVLRNGRIEAVGPAATTRVPAGAQVLDLAGHTVIPGLVMLHEHLYYALSYFSPDPGIGLASSHGYSFPRLYLAGGVTSLRTGGSIEPYTDLSLKKLVDSGKLVGPKIHVTGPYIGSAGLLAPQLFALRGPEDARRLVAYWADAGVTSFKVYNVITRAELAAALEEAHRRGLKVTGHLCSIGFREAAALGINNLEHGLTVNTEFIPDKQPDVCPGFEPTVNNIATLDVGSEPVQQTIRELVRRGVAVTSTLPVFETFVPNRPPLDPRVLAAMHPDFRLFFLQQRAQIAEKPHPGLSAMLAKEMQFELAFARAGGLLLAGSDPTGYGGVVPGFANQRQVELLVEAGFSPLEAIQISTYNGAKFLDVLDQVGTVAAGKAADLVVLKGNPAERISDIRNVEIVFKDGVGYDPARLIESARGMVGLR